LSKPKVRSTLPQNLWQLFKISYIEHPKKPSLFLDLGLAKARYLGLERNKTRAQLIAMSHNLKTGMNIFKQLTIGYNENMYTKFDHKKKKYYTIQGNK
jgi:IS5 family transposase